MAPGDLPYAAFISYSHTSDRAVATALQNALHRFARGWSQRRALQIFRDESILSANPHLWGSIESALKRSRFFILLASPESARSVWVQREVAFWRAQRAADRPLDDVLIVLTDGKIAWDDTAGDFDWARTTALPDGLRNAFAGVPLYVDLRWARASDTPTLDDPRFIAAIADLAATLHGRSKDELIGEDLLQYRRARRIWRLAVSALTLLAIGMAVATGVSYRQRNLAFVSQSRFLADASRQELEAGDAETAILLALEALPQTVHPFGRPVVPQAEAALYEAVLSDREQRVLKGHQDAIRSIAFSADGRSMLSLSRDRTARLWDVALGQSVAVFGDGDRKADLIAAMQCEGRDRQVLTISADGTVRFWAIGEKNPRRTFSVLSEGKRHEHRESGFEGIVDFLGEWSDAALTSMFAIGSWPFGDFKELEAFASRDCRTLFVQQLTAQAMVWDATTATPLRPLGKPDEWPLAAWLETGKPRIATRRSDGTRILWDADGGVHLATLPVAGARGALASVFRQLGRALPQQLLRSVPLDVPEVEDLDLAFTAAAISGDGKLFASSVNGSAVVVELPTGRTRAVLPGHEGIVTSIDMGPDGRVVTTGTDATTRIWDSASGRLLQTLREENEIPFFRARFSHDGSMLVTSSRGVKLWDARNGQLLSTLRPRGGGSITEIAFTPDDRHVLAGTSIGEISIWSARPAYERKTESILTSPAGNITDVSFVADGPRIVAASDDGVVRVSKGDASDVIELRAETADTTKTVSDANPSTRTSTVRLSGDGNRFVALSRDEATQRVSLWDARARRLITTLDLDGLIGIRFAGFSPDDRSIIVHDGNEKWIAYRTYDAGGKPVAGTRRAVIGGEQAAPSSTGQYVASIRMLADEGRADIELSDILRDTHTSIGKVPFVAAPASQTRERPVLAVSADGDAVVFGAGDGAVHLFTGCQSWWGATHHILTGHATAIDRALFGPAGRLITSSESGTSLLWDYRTGRLAAELPLPLDGVFSPDGQRMITTAGELWDMAHALKIATLPLPWRSRVLGDASDSRWQFAWSPDGSRIVAHASDRQAYVFPVQSLDALMAVARRVVRDTSLNRDQRARYFLD
jgi:WD40 repeat protein